MRIASCPSVSLSVLCLILTRYENSEKPKIDVAYVTFNSPTSFTVSLKVKVTSRIMDSQKHVYIPPIVTGHVDYMQ